MTAPSPATPLADLAEIWRRPLPELASAPHRALVRLALSAVGWSVRIAGRERLAALPDPSLLVFNHNNAYECLAMPAALLFERGGRPVHFLVDWMFLRIPGLKGLMGPAAPPIPVYTKRARWGLWERHRRRHRQGSALAAALARLEAGQTVGLFPEGTRVACATRLGRARRGLADVVLASRVPVLPIGIEFSAARRLGRTPGAGRMTLRVGQALDFAPERMSPQDGYRQRSALARRIDATVMGALAALSGKRADLAGTFDGEADEGSQAMTLKGGSYAAG